MVKRKAAARPEEQTSKQQDKRGVIIPGPATPAWALADWLAKKESEASLSKRRHRPRVNNPGSATKSEEATKRDLDMEERLRKAAKSCHKAPIPDPRAKPTRTPPQDHYITASQWEGIDSKLLNQQASYLDNDMYQWTYTYVDDDPDVIEARMTAKDKQAIIDYLGDWCLFNDWESLVASFSLLNYLDRFHILLTATVLKNVFESVVRNPFFYIDLGESWDGSSSDLPPPYGVELNKLFQKGLKVSASGAHHWRASTIRLFNRYLEHGEDIETPLTAQDVRPGIRAYNLREKCIDLFTSNILDKSSLIFPMLSPRKLSLDQAKSRYSGMRNCYKTACKLAVCFSLQKAGFKFDESAKEVAPYQIPSQDENDRNRWAASIFNDPGKYNELLQGRRAVLVLWPATWIIEWKTSDHTRETREKLYAEFPPDYSRSYLDEKGVHHAVITAGIVILEKGARESPLDSD